MASTRRTGAHAVAPDAKASAAGPRQCRFRAWVLALDVIAIALVGEGLAQGYLLVDRWISGPNLVDLLAVDPSTGLRIPRAGASTDRVSINTLGFRGPDIAVPKPAGVTRIAFLGGSTTFCWEVSSDVLTWPHLVTESLRARFPDRRFDYVNAGVPGYAVRDSHRAFAARVAALDPDVVIVYHGVNDLLRSGTEAARAQGVALGDTAGEPSWLTRHSALAHFLKRALVTLSRRHLASDPDRKISIAADSLTPTFAADLEALIEDAKGVADVVAVATFATRLSAGRTIEDDLAADGDLLFYLPVLTGGDFVRLLRAYNEAISEVARRTGAVLVAGADAVPADARHFADSVHFTDDGSRWMADRVTRALADALARASVAGERRERDGQASHGWNQELER